jgi:hypothetical protein
MFSKSLMKHFKGFGSRFAELHAKYDADTLLDSAIHRRQNEIPVEKALVQKQRVRSTASCGRLMQLACGSVPLASPFIFFH